MVDYSKKEEWCGRRPPWDHNVRELDCEGQSSFKVAGSQTIVIDLGIDDRIISPFECI